jgi:hypothetical protein
MGDGHMWMWIHRRRRSRWVHAVQRRTDRQTDSRRRRSNEAKGPRVREYLGAGPAAFTQPCMHACKA